MSLFFFLSGLFVWQSLERKGVRTFLRDRIVRLGIPFAFVVALLMPLANYPTYLQTATDPSFTAFWGHWLALPFWPCGPMWFLWLLLVADFAAAAVHQFAPRWGDTLIRFSSSAGARPVCCRCQSRPGASNWGQISTTCASAAGFGRAFCRGKLPGPGNGNSDPIFATGNSRFA
jgi:acyltransferase-like protein